MGNNNKNFARKHNCKVCNLNIIRDCIKSKKCLKPKNVNNALVLTQNDELELLHRGIKCFGCD